MNTNEIIETASQSFIADAEKMNDFKNLTKEEFLLSYSYLSEKEYDATQKYMEFLAGKSPENKKKLSLSAENECIRLSYDSILKIRDSQSLTPEEKSSFIDKLISATADVIHVPVNDARERFRALEDKSNIITDIKQVQALFDHTMHTYRNIDFRNMDFSNIKFNGSDFVNCQGINSNFQGADFGNCHFKNCGFVDCDLTKAIFCPEFDMCEDAFQNVHFVRCNMQEADFSLCDLSCEQRPGNCFENCTLTKANFEKSRINEASFYGCILKEASFSDARFHNVDFTDCDLESSCLLDAEFYLTDFENTSLEDADFSRASLKYNTYNNCNLKDAGFANCDLLKMTYDFVADAVKQGAIMDNVVECIRKDGKGFEKFDTSKMDMSFNVEGFKQEQAKKQAEQTQPGDSAQKKKEDKSL